MPQCKPLRRKKRQPCIGDLDTQIQLQNRAIAPPTTSVDFSEQFTDAATVWAMINSVRGVTIFDNSNVERDVTHEITIRYDASVTAETWILHDGKRIDILDVEDLEERHDWLVLRCAILGRSTDRVNDA